MVNKKQPDLSKALRLGVEDTDNGFHTPEAIARLANDESEWMGLGFIDERERGLIMGELHLYQRAVSRHLDVTRLVWNSMALSRSVRGRGVYTLRDMEIADRNRSTDEKSGWGAMIARPSPADSNGKVQQ